MFVRTMKFAKVFILLYFLICIAKANTQNVDTSLTNRKLTQIRIETDTDTNKIIHFNHCAAAINENNFSLYYLNDKCLGKNFIDKYFINPHSIKAIEVIKKSPKYKHNKVILKTIESIKWISSKTIARIYSNEKYSEILFEIDNKKYVFKNKTYFDSHFLRTISFVDTNENFNDKFYYFKIVINSKNN